MNTVPGKKNKNIKSNLVNQGKVILAAYGYKEMNLRALCQQAGVSTGAFYTRFAHKKELALYIADAVNVLCDGGFLTKDDKHFISLTEEGRKVAEKIYERHKFFKEQLISAGVSPNIAETEACRIEHCVSDESFLKLKQHHEKDKG